MSSDVEVLAESLADGTTPERIQTLALLAGLGELAAPASVAVLNCLLDQSETVREYANETLENMGPPRLQDGDEIAKRLEQENSDIVYWAVTLIGRLGSDAAEFVIPVTNALNHSESMVKERAAWTLGRIGRPAMAAIPVLKSAMKSESARLSHLAEQAIELISK